MATLPLSSPSPSFTIHNRPQPSNLSTLHLKPPKLNSSTRSRSRHKSLIITSYKVVVEEHEGETTALEVEPDETILNKALDHGLSVPHDCKLGVCMTCPAKLVSGSVDQNEGMLSDDVVDQNEGMLSDDVVERGYALLCASYPRSDCHIKTIPEDELLATQLATAND